MMNSGSQFSQLFASFWWAIPLLILISLFKTLWFKGFIGEVMLTCKQLNNSCLTPTYTYLCMVRCLMLKINPHSNWKARLHALMSKHADVPQAQMGFPPDWQDDPFWKASVAGEQT